MAESLEVQLQRLEALVAALLAAPQVYQPKPAVDAARKALDTFRSNSAFFAAERNPDAFAALAEFVAHQRLISEHHAVANMAREDHQRLEELEAAMAQLTWDRDIGMPLAESRPKSMPIRIFLSSGAEPRLVEMAVTGLLETIEFVGRTGYAKASGSYFSEWWAKIKTAASTDDVNDRLKRVERAVELQVLGRPQAEIDERTAKAAAELIKAIHEEPHAAIQIGSLFLVKTMTANGPRLIVRTLTQAEMIALETRAETFQTKPTAFAQALTELALGGRPPEESPRQLPPP